MSLIAMAVYDTEENNRTQYTAKTLASLWKTVDFTKHRLVLSDNGSCEETMFIYSLWHSEFKRVGLKLTVINNGKNLGTAEAINKAWQLRKPGEHAIKMDNDVVIHQPRWVDQMEDAISRDPKIGIIGLKRKDCWQNPKHEDPNLRSTLELLPRAGVQPWLVVEKTNDIMGTCTMFNSGLLDKIGYLFQPGLYGYDDVLACYRSRVGGFYNCFLPSIEIDHIDSGETPYQEWKERYAGEHTEQMIKIVDEYINKTRPIYYNPFQ